MEVCYLNNNTTNKDCIDSIRKEMEEYAMEQGCTSPEALQLSKKLDEYVAKRLQEQLNSYLKDKHAKQT